MARYLLAIFNVGEAREASKAQLPGEAFLLLCIDLYAEHSAAKFFR